MAAYVLVYMLSLVFTFVSSQIVSPGHVWLTLNQCGLYPSLQGWSLGSDRVLRLTQDSNTCVQCSNVGYCTSGFPPVTTTGCSGSNYMETWSTQSVQGNVVKLETNNLCATPMGIEDYAMITVLPCNVGYNNDALQQWLINPHGKNYIVSNQNQSLCLTANKYLPRNCSQSLLNQMPYCNVELPTHDRVNDLLQRMSVYEKISNLAYGNIGVPRLGVPANMQLECLHGIRTQCGESYNGNTGCPTSFPHALLLGATFNRSLWHLIGEAISDEGRALNNQGIGGLYCYSPDINLFRVQTRDGVEGEDPFLTGQYGMEYINGIQFGEDTRYLKMSNTVKHFADYSIEGGRYGIPARTDFNAIVSSQDQVEYYWPAWRTVIQTANAHSMMCSYPAINSVPACGNDYFMNEIARNQWGFDGLIISDQGAIADDMFTAYVKAQNNNNDDPLLRTKLAIESGCDANIGDVYLSYLYAAITHNYTTESVLNKAVYRFMFTMIELGQIDYPQPIYSKYGPEYVDSPKNRQLSLSAAVQGIVLLKNEENILPLSRDNSIKYAFIGPHFNATQYMLSSYVGSNTLVNGHSPYQIAKEQGLNVIGSPGCKDLGCEDVSGFDDAINSAKNVDFAVVFLGLEPLNFAQSNDAYNTAVEAENFDRENITFPGNQLQLLQKVFAANPKTILVLFNGSPIDISWPAANVNGIIESFYPGELGGDAILSVLFGDVSPAGKLPYTIYDVSITQNRQITDMGMRENGGITYRYYEGTPVYPFGFGLSYTNFSYLYFEDESERMIETKTLADWYRNGMYFHSDESTSYNVQVTNTGNMDSDCVILGFVTSDNTDSPLLKLFDFQRVFVEKGQSVNVSLSVSPETISLTNKRGIERIVPGNYTLYIGDYQTYKAQPKKASFIETRLHLIGEEEVIFDLERVKKYKK